MVELTALLSLAKECPDALQGITLKGLMRFVVYTGKLKNDILLVQLADHPSLVPPPVLPKSITMFLAKACDMSNVDQVYTCWDLLKDMIWGEEPEADDTDNAIFEQHGYSMGISTFPLITNVKSSLSLCAITAPQTLYPPQHTCQNTDCSCNKRNLTLKKAEQRQAVLFTSDQGVIPVWSVHLYCEGKQHR